MSWVTTLMLLGVRTVRWSSFLVEWDWHCVGILIETVSQDCCPARWRSRDWDRGAHRVLPNYWELYWSSSNDCLFLAESQSWSSYGIDFLTARKDALSPSESRNQMGEQEGCYSICRGWISWHYHASVAGVCSCILPVSGFLPNLGTLVQHESVKTPYLTKALQKQKGQAWGFRFHCQL